MNIYDIWIDGSQNCHLISEMDTDYINRCIGQIRKVANSWRFDSFYALSESEKDEICIPLKKAWFVVNGNAYLKSFRSVLEKRGEDTSQVNNTIMYSGGSLVL